MLLLLILYNRKAWCYLWIALQHRTNFLIQDNYELFKMEKLSRVNAMLDNVR